VEKTDTLKWFIPSLSMHPSLRVGGQLAVEKVRVSGREFCWNEFGAERSEIRVQGLGTGDGGLGSRIFFTLQPSVE